MKVAVAIIFNDQQQILITRRSMTASHGGMWEFPGGKLEAGELPSTALIREIKEEVGINILNSYFLGEVVHSYEHRTVELLVFKVTQFIGSPSRLESQMDLRWVKVEELSNYEFPAANLQIVSLIKKDITTSLNE